MDNAVNIMTMVQSNSIVKKKFDVPSKTLGSVQTIFRKELNQARKEIRKETNFEAKDVEANTQSTTEKKIEKFARVMANNSVKAEVNAEVKENPSVEALEQTEETEIKANGSVADVKQVEQIEEDINVKEPMQSVLDMLQQLIEMMQIQKSEGASTTQLAELNTKLQEVFQMLEQIIEMPMANKTPELNQMLGSLKNDLSELVAKLEIVPEYKLDSKQSEQMISQLSDKLNQAKVLNNQIPKQTEIPKTDSEVAKLPLAQVIKVENKEVESKTDAKVVEVEDEIQQIQKSDSDKTSDNKMYDNKTSDNKMSDNKTSQDKPSNNKDSEEVESTYKTNEKTEVLQATSTDKLNQTDVNKVVVPQVDKENFQLNIKQANENLQKESTVKFSTSDVINQVIKKAEVFVQGSHQEMIMKLEPESLGKLNLKIILENGLVTAKFMAESQQVKAILESNFNQLKDALQEKGIIVQSFSVSVNQQGAEFDSNKGFAQWKKTIKLNKVSGEYMGLDEEVKSSINPYSYHDGKVDFRA